MRPLGAVGNNYIKSLADVNNATIWDFSIFRVTILGRCLKTRTDELGAGAGWRQHDGQVGVELQSPLTHYSFTSTVSLLMKKCLLIGGSFVPLRLVGDSYHI